MAELEPQTCSAQEYMYRFLSHWNKDLVAKLEICFPTRLRTLQLCGICWTAWQSGRKISDCTIAHDTYFVATSFTTLVFFEKLGSQEVSHLTLSESLSELLDHICKVLVRECGRSGWLIHDEPAFARRRSVIPMRFVVELKSPSTSL